MLANSLGNRKTRPQSLKAYQPYTAAALNATSLYLKKVSLALNGSQSGQFLSSFDLHEQTSYYFGLFSSIANLTGQTKVVVFALC